MAILRCQDLVVGYRGTPLLPPLNLEVEGGELLFVIGCNGAGKSTWLKTVLGLIPPVSGTVERAPSSLRMTYVPQESGLDEVIPVRSRDVVSWGHLHGWSFLKPFSNFLERKRTRLAIEQAQARDFASLPFRELSGGQRQRVLFARMLSAEADIILLDEPTASMDAYVSALAYEMLASLARDRGIAVVVVTHHMTAAASMADRVLFLDRGRSSGKGIVQIGSPDEVFDDPDFQRVFGESHHAH